MRNKNAIECYGPLLKIMSGCWFFILSTLNGMAHSTHTHTHKPEQQKREMKKMGSFDIKMVAMLLTSNEFESRRIVPQ